MGRRLIHFPPVKFRARARTLWVQHHTQTRLGRLGLAADGRLRWLRPERGVGGRTAADEAGGAPCFFFQFCLTFSST